jgi:predicted ribosomally synthesized peptide with SipW-like signal peptide
MKSIIKSLLIVVAVAAVAGGATWSYFNDTATINNETFSAGTVTLNINTDDTYYTNGGTVRTTVQDHFENLKPGDTMRQWVTLHNAGSLDIGSLTIQATPVNDPAGLLSQIKVSVIGYDNNPPFANNAYFTPGWGTGGSPINSWLTAAPQDILSSAAVQWSPGPVPGKITPTQDDLIVLDFVVPTTMGNAYQGASANFDLVFTAEQVH